MLSSNNFCIFSFNSISASVTSASVRYIELIDANKSHLARTLIIIKNYNCHMVVGLSTQSI